MRKEHFVNISLWCEFTPPWNRANLLHSASSNSTRRYCHYSYACWRWASFTWTTWPGYLTMSHCDICCTLLPAPLPDMFLSLLKTRLASTPCQRLQYRHSSPNRLLEILQTCFFVSLPRVPLSTNTKPLVELNVPPVNPVIVGVGSASVGS